MSWSMWIPWNFQWIYIANSCTIPYGFHGRVHIKFCGKSIKWVVKKSINIKNWTLSSATHHMHVKEGILTAEAYDCCRIVNCPLLIVLRACHAQSKCWQILMLDLDAINTQQLFLHNHHHLCKHPATTTMPSSLTATTHIVVAIHSKSLSPRWHIFQVPCCWMWHGDQMTNDRIIICHHQLVSTKLLT